MDIFDDPDFRLCLSLAALSKSKYERYGSVLKMEGEIIGIGYNRAIYHNSFPEPLHRLIVQGRSNHAEGEGINTGLCTLLYGKAGLGSFEITPDSGSNARNVEQMLTTEIIRNGTGLLNGAELTVVGYFPLPVNGSPAGMVYLVQKETFTCSLCSRLMIREGIGSVRVPSSSGFISMTPQEAYEYSLGYYGNGLPLEARAASVVNRVTIYNSAIRLLQREEIIIPAPSQLSHARS